MLIDMDRRDEHSGKLEEIYDQLHSAYCQLNLLSPDSGGCSTHNHRKDKNDESTRDSGNSNTGGVIELL